ncbi:NAD-dependent epimerase/dehydratase family protein [bacterium]|nr:NAD-dependent epimerase/dehydratase family protein [bacterium]
MSDVVVFGYGPVGAAVTARLLAEGAAVRVAQRRRPAELPPQAAFIPCDLLNEEAVRSAAAGARQVVLAAGFPYVGKIWAEAWPRAMHHALAACEAAGSRLVFADNLYMYGPQTAALVETMPLTDRGRKPAARAKVTRLWQEASKGGRVRVAALRAPDFYGPGVANSHLGGPVFGSLAKGRAATLLVDPDMPHDFAYVPDFARGIVSLLAAKDDVFGQAWHLPCAPTRTPREIIGLAAASLGVEPRIRRLPFALQTVIAPVVPFFREMAEMRFQWDRSYSVDSSKFSARFWGDATSFETGIDQTVRSFRL